MKNNNQSDIGYMIMYIDHIMNYLNSQQQNNINLRNNPVMFQFNMKKQTFLSAIVYNKDCINHLKISEKDPIKYHKKRSQLFENSDRLSCLTFLNL